MVSELHKRYYLLSTQLDWEKLVLFSDRRLFYRGRYLTFLAMLIEDEEAGGSKGPFEEMRLQTMLQGWIEGLLALLKEWEQRVSLLSSGSEANLDETASLQVSAFKQLIKVLDSTVDCYQISDGEQFGNNLSFRDSEQNLCIVSATSMTDKADFINRKAILTQLLNAFRDAPGLDVAS